MSAREGELRIQDIDEESVLVVAIAALVRGVSPAAGTGRAGASGAAATTLAIPGARAAAPASIPVHVVPVIAVLVI